MVIYIYMLSVIISAISAFVRWISLTTSIMVAVLVALIGNVLIIVRLTMRAMMMRHLMLHLLLLMMLRIVLIPSHVYTILRSWCPALFANKKVAFEI